MSRARGCDRRRAAAVLVLLAGTGLAAGVELPAGVLGEVAGEPLGALEASTVALLLTGQQGGEISGAAVWVAEVPTEAGGLRRVTVVTDLDGAAVVAGDPGPDLAIVALGYAVSADGEVGARFAEGFRVPAGPLLDAVRRRGLKVAAPLSLPPGRWSLRQVIRNVRTGRMRVTRLIVDLPPADSPGPWLQPPLAAEPEEGWLLARASALATLPRVGPEGRLPTALPLAVQGRPLVLELRGTVSAGAAAARLVDRLGRTVEEPPLEVDVTGPGSARAVLVSTDVVPGHYRLVVTLAGGEAGALSQELPIAVVDREPPTVAAIVEPAIVADSRLAAEQVVAALGALCRGDEAAALDGVSAIEREVWRQGGHDALGRLRGAQSSAMQPLARRPGAALLPVAVLYRRLAREYNRPGEEPLAFHAWSLAADLADRLAETAGRPAGPALAAAVQAALARDRILSGDEAFAAELMTRALRHLPRQPELLLGLAVLEERRGDHQGAAELLGRCLRAAPDSWEARLRLGVNLGRTRRLGPAVRELDRVADDPGAPAWARAVALQEKASALAAAGDAPAALAAVREGRVALPADQQLLVLQAVLLDRLGDARGAAAAVIGMPPAADPLAPAPRMRYMSAPSIGLELWEIARSRTPEALEDLAAALAERAAGTGAQPSQSG